MAVVLVLGKTQEQMGARPAEAGTPKPLALVAANHEDTRFLLKYLLTMRGYDVAEAGNGEEAVDAAERLRPSLILMDYSLPRLDGVGAMRRMRELAVLSTVPIIILSGHAEPAWQVEARAAGCDDYLIKPFDMERLDRALARHLSGNHPARP